MLPASDAATIAMVAGIGSEAKHVTCLAFELSAAAITGPPFMFRDRSQVTSHSKHQLRILVPALHV